MAQGKIPFVRIHRLIRFRREEIDRWLESFDQEVRPASNRFQNRDHRDINILVARAKREVYNTPRGGRGYRKGMFFGDPGISPKEGEEKWGCIKEIRSGGWQSYTGESKSEDPQKSQNKKLAEKIYFKRLRSRNSETPIS